MPAFMHRRHRSGWVSRLLLVSTVVSMVLAGVAVAPQTADAATYRATANLNLRSGPGTTYSVIGGIPGGASVEVTGEAEDGYLPVTYNGVSGYASAQYLTADGGGGGTTTGPTGTRYVSDGRLNLRSGPGTSYGVIVVMPDGGAVQLTGQVSGSFSQVTYSGTTGWAATEFLATSGPTAPTPTATPIPPTLTATPVTPTPTTPAATATTTNPGAPSIGDTVVGSATVATGGLSLNMRSGPGTGYGVVRGIPNGSRVDVMGDAVNGFRPVRHSGTKGWASAQYLTIGTAPDPTATPVTPTPTATPETPAPTMPGNTIGTATVATGGLNLLLRSGAGSSFGVMASMPNGTQVEVLGAAQNGYTPVRYQGTSGWAATQYLRASSATPTATPVTPLTPTPTATPVTPVPTTPGGATGTATVTTGGLNLLLRSGAGASFGVLASMPNGSPIDVLGAAQNGYTPVRYQGTSGWAATQYLSASSATPTATPVTPTPSPTTIPSPTPSPTATATPPPTFPGGNPIDTAVVSVSGANLNMRSGPGTTYPVIRGLANGTQVDVMGAAQNGFRPIRAGGTNGWAHQDYLTIGGTAPQNPSNPPIGNTEIGKATINTTVWKRTGPGTTYSANEHLVAGRKVDVMGNAVNGWTPIRYNGSKGWVPSSHLDPGWGWTVVDQMITTRIIPMTTAPGGGTFVINVGRGSVIDITGPASGVYLPVQWYGRLGWVDGTSLIPLDEYVDPGPRNQHEADMIAIVYEYADKWGLSRADFLRVARCESSLTPTAVSSAGAQGLFQFMPSTWAFTPNGKAGQDPFDPRASADAAGWMWANGMRHHWMCA